MEVYIKRSCQSGKVSEVNISEIDGIVWDNMSGGRKEKHFGYALYGYINYNLAKEIVDCSGKHCHIADRAKIMIPKSLNRRGENKNAYRLLVEKTGRKPACREDGQIPCRKRIMEIVNNEKEITRKRLRDILISEKYDVKLIRGALNSMKKGGRINMVGNVSPNQIISLGNI